MTSSNQLPLQSTLQQWSSTTETSTGIAGHTSVTSDVPLLDTPELTGHSHSTGTDSAVTARPTHTHRPPQWYSDYLLH